MSIRQIFITIAAVMLTSAVFADSASVTSKKYVDDFMTGYQNKIPGSGTNKLMIYDSNESDGINQKAIVSSLGENTSATDVPNVGAVLDGLDGKQETFNGTAGYVMTGMGTDRPGEVGERAIYGTAVYSNSLVTAETVNTGVTNAVNSSLIRVDANGNPSDSGTLWEINTDLFAIGVLPAGYTQLEYVVFNGTQVLDTGFAPNQDTKIVSKFNGTTSPTWVYGTGNSNPLVTCYLASSGNQRFGNVTVDNTGIVANTINVVTQDKNGFDLNGNLTAYSNVGNFTSLQTLTIGNSNGSNSTAYFSGNFYYMKIYDNGTLVRDYVPAIDSNNTVGFWDKVSGTFTTPSTGILANGPVVGN